MTVTINGTTGITTPDIDSTTSTLGPLTQALDLGSTGQIVFPATQNASSNANTLDDYEEGTWTPVLAFGGISGSNIVYSGNYTKIGRVVTVNFLATSTTSSNDVVISSYAGFSGMPFSSANFTGSGAVITEDIDVFSTLGFCHASATFLVLSKCGSGTQTSSLFATATYFV